MATLPQDKLDALTKRFDSIEAALSSGPSAEQFVKLSKEYAELEPVVRPIQAYQKLLADLESAEELAGSGDKDMAARFHGAQNCADVGGAIFGCGEEVKYSPVMPDIERMCRPISIENVSRSPSHVSAMRAGDCRNW